MISLETYINNLPSISITYMGIDNSHTRKGSSFSRVCVMRPHAIDLKGFEGAAICSIPQPPPIRREHLARSLHSHLVREFILSFLLIFGPLVFTGTHPASSEWKADICNKKLKSKSSRLTRTLLAGSNKRKSSFVKSSAGWFKSLGLHRS